MTAPSWYGEPVVTYADQARTLLIRHGAVRQDGALDVLSRGRDTCRDGAASGFADLIASGEAVMVWDYAGIPYYVRADLADSIRTYPHPDYPTGMYADRADLFAVSA